MQRLRQTIHARYIPRLRESLALTALNISYYTIIFAQFSMKNT